MNGNVLSAPTDASQELAELRARVRTLEARLDRLESSGPAAIAAQPRHEKPHSAASAPARIDTEVAAATIFTRVAMLCFVLLGALILRVLTQQGILNARFGTILGFTYAAHLIALSLIPGGFGKFARESSLFQCSGVLLAFVIALECALRTLTMGRISAMIVIAGFALFALAMSLQRRKASIGTTGVIGGILALVALDMKSGTMALQLGFVVLLAAAGLASSWLEKSKWLRVPVMLLTLALLPSALFFCRTEPGVSNGILAASAAMWCVVLGQHLVAFRRLGNAAVWLPVTTLWLIGVQQAAGWPHSAVAAAAIGGFTLSCVFFFVRRPGACRPGIAGLIATVGLAGAFGWAMLDRTGLLCAAGAMALWFAARRIASDWASVFATLLMLAAAAAALTQVFRPPVASFGLCAMLLCAVLFIFHYVRNSRVGQRPYAGLYMRLAPVALAAGLGCLLGLCWELLSRTFEQPAQLLLSQTALVVITALALTSWGHAAHRRAPLFCGLACMALALGKVLAIDLVRLKSVNMLISLVMVGLASVAVPIILRRADSRTRVQQISRNQQI